VDQKTIDAIQGAFKQAMDAFNVALVKALGAKGATSAIVAAPAVLAAPKHRGRPAKVKSIVDSLVSAAPKRRGRPPKKVDVLAKLVAATPKRRGRPAKAK